MNEHRRRSGIHLSVNNSDSKKMVSTVASTKLLTVVAMVAWGGYSLLGRSAADPLESTAINFIYSVPMAIIVTLFAKHNSGFSCDACSDCTE